MQYKTKVCEGTRMSCSSCNSNDIKSRGVWWSRGSEDQSLISLITKALRNYTYKATSTTLISSFSYWGRLTGRDVHMFGKERGALSDSCCFTSTMSVCTEGIQPGNITVYEIYIHRLLLKSSSTEAESRTPLDFKSPTHAYFHVISVSQEDSFSSVFLKGI